MSGTLEAIRYSRGKLELLDQTKLPREFVYDRIQTCEECFDAIRTMRVRGAPAIAVSAALSLAIEAASLIQQQKGQLPHEELTKWIVYRTELLEKSRPTAVNLRNCCCHFRELVKNNPNSGLESIIQEAEKMLRLDGISNKAIGDCGRDCICNVLFANKQRKPMRMLTHCNAGALATARYGTALGVARSIHSIGSIGMVYTCETRPWNQLWVIKMKL